MTVEQQDLQVGVYDSETGELKRCIGVADPRVAFCAEWDRNNRGLQARPISNETAEAFAAEHLVAPNS